MENGITFTQISSKVRGSISSILLIYPYFTCDLSRIYYPYYKLYPEIIGLWNCEESSGKSEILRA